MSQPLPSDFPDIDLAAWNASMPFPDEPGCVDEITAFAFLPPDDERTEDELPATRRDRNANAPQRRIRPRSPA